MRQSRGELIAPAARTITRARTGSVAASFLVHVGYNLMLFVLLFFTTDRFRHLERMG